MTTVVTTVATRHGITTLYCRYYSRHAIVVTTVVTTVATENHMPTYAIFFLMYGCLMLGTDLKKNRMIFAHRVQA